MDRPIHVRAPATSANLGPAFDAAGIALDWWDELEARPAPVDGIQLSGEQAELLPTGRDNLIRVAMRRLAGIPPQDPPGPEDLEAEDLGVLPLPTIWPLAAALGFTILFTGLIYGLWLVILGLGLAGYAAWGWLAVATREHRYGRLEADTEPPSPAAGPVSDPRPYPDPAEPPGP